jgi:uncharacterized protein YjbI with pentapeptide repeats
MADYSREEVLEKIKKGEGLERADLRDVALNKANLENANLRRSDLEGVNFEESNLKRANLSSANLRDGYLVRADLEGANLQKADLEGANLEGANLQNADLSRANLEGASLEGAKLQGARLNYAQLELANLGGALLEGAQLTNADLRETYLGGAKLIKADLQFAKMEKANLEESNLSEANLQETNLRNAYLEGANLSGAVLKGAILEGADLNRADLLDADLRHCNLKNTKLVGTKMTGTKLFGIDAAPEQFNEVVSEWVDFSSDADGKTRTPGTNLAEQYKKIKSGPAPVPDHSAASASAISTPSSDQAKRFFGRGDVLRNATLEFGEKSLVEIESKFEKCSIKLGDGAHLIIGPNGVLEGCQISGSGEIVVHGQFSEDGNSPGIIGPKRLLVGKAGSVTGAVQQPPELTQFGFERGCHLKLKIFRSK